MSTPLLRFMLVTLPPELQALDDSQTATFHPVDESTVPLAFLHDIVQLALSIEIRQPVEDGLDILGNTVLNLAIFR